MTTTDTFRLCALGAIDVEDIEEFFKVLREALIENNIQVLGYNTDSERIQYENSIYVFCYRRDP